MNPRVGAGLFVLCLVGAGLFWWMQRPPEVEVPTPPRVVAAAPVPVAPTVGPRIYNLPREPAEAPSPAPAPMPNPAPLARETHLALTAATNEALGAGWQECVRPWLEEDPIDDDTPAEPLVVFFDMVDGRLSDVRLRSPIDLPEDLVSCFAEAVWRADFPEDPDHRGQVSVQRVLTIKK